jgi:putative transposase
MDFLHKISYFLITNFDTLCLETLKSGNMMKNHKLAQTLSDIAIGKFNELIDYKSEWYGTNILRIGQFEPSSKMCSCGTINKELKLSQRVWTCSSCGTTHDRDVLAANNIKHFAFTKNNTAGTAEIHACGDMMDVSQSAQETKPSLVVW